MHLKKLLLALLLTGCGATIGPFPHPPPQPEPPDPWPDNPPVEQAKAKPAAATQQAPQRKP